MSTTARGANNKSKGPVNKLTNLNKPKPAYHTSLPKVNSNSSLTSSRNESPISSKRPISSNSSSSDNIYKQVKSYQSSSCPSTITVDEVIYDEKKIKELLNKNAVLNQELQECQKKLKDKEFQIRTKDVEINDLKQNYDKVKSVLDQKNAREIEEHLGGKNSRITSAHRFKKQGVSAESLASNKVDMRTYDKPDSAITLITNALNNCSNDFMKMMEPRQIRNIACCMYEKKVKSNCYIIRENDVGNEMYVLAEGKLEVLKDGKKLRDMYPGELFGELAVLQNCLRTASVKAVCDVTFWTIDRKVYQAILQNFNSQKQEVYQQFLKSVPLFKDFSPVQMNKLCDALTPETFTKNELIIKEGDDGHTFYIIKEGEVRIEKVTENGKSELLRTLKTGDYFGEQALIKNEIRTASVYATSDHVELLVLDQDDFGRLIGQISEISKKQYADIDNTKVLRENKYDNISLDDLETIATLGVGGFGRVELVRSKKQKKDVFALKCMKKCFIVKMKQQDHVFSERDILLDIRSEFVCQLYRTYRDNKFIYMLMEVCLGGEVWTILRNRISFDDKMTKFVLACVLFALEYIHSKNIIYRDLKPENLLLDKQGYVKLCDFGFAKKLSPGRKTYTFCGTPEYVAPEIIMNRGHDYAADLWSLGILIIELLTGSPPFQADDPMKVYNQILKGLSKKDFPSKVSKVAQSLVTAICKNTPSERLGYGKNGVSDIRSHRYFSDISWEKIEKREFIPPIIPKIDNEIDCKNFDQFPPDNEKIPDELSGWDIGFENGAI